jgi:hypothetical protein
MHSSSCRELVRFSVQANARSALHRNQKTRGKVGINELLRGI